MQVTADKEVVVILDGVSGFEQHLLRPDAQVLLDKLKEFQHREGSTDVSLTEFRALHITGCPTGVSFSFFYREQGPRKPIEFNKQQTAIAIRELTRLLEA